jgi:hypothetical protein
MVFSPSPLIRYNRHGRIHIANANRLKISGTYVHIELPNGLSTKLSASLPFKQQLVGQTEIVTEDVTLLGRLFSEFRRLLDVK